MTAHVFNRKLDSNFPATLSKTVITGLLRERLNYDGVVISDDIQMRAIADEYGFEAAIDHAIEAGIDIILIANNSLYEEDITARAAGVIKKLLLDGRVSEERINESFARIQRLKKRISTPQS